MEEQKGNNTEQNKIENQDSQSQEESVQYYPPKKVHQSLPKKPVPVWIPITLVLVVVLGLGGYTTYVFLSQDKVEDTDQIACTQDVKKCEDGSFVQRIPPACRFEACPAIEDETMDDDMATSTATSTTNGGGLATTTPEEGDIGGGADVAPSPSSAQ